MTLTLAPATFRQAQDLVEKLHRHHGPTRGHLFSIAAYEDGRLCGIATVGRPVARMLQDGTTAEVTRLVTDGTDNACSKLYGASWRAWRAMGGVRMFTYILADEPGTSLRAAGWLFDGMTSDNDSWHRLKRPRPTEVPQGAKQRWRAHK